MNIEYNKWISSKIKLQLMDSIIVVISDALINSPSPATRPTPPRTEGVSTTSKRAKYYLQLREAYRDERGLNMSLPLEIAEAMLE